MLKTAEEQKLEEDSNKYFYMNKVIDNIKVKQQNGRLWTPYHDMQLYEYVIKYKFNFYEISNAFQRLCINDKKYEYSEDAVRLHWAFLHAMRFFEQTPDEAYYQRMKLQYDKEKPKTFKKTVEDKEKEKEKNLNEKEEIKKMKEEYEKMIGGGMESTEKNHEKNGVHVEVELDKKEKEEVEELILESKKKKEEEEKKNEENKDNNEINQEKEEEKGNKQEIKVDNKLFDEANEPEYIKQLFNKNIPQEILDKLNKDEGKYNNNNSNQNTPEKQNQNTNKEIITTSEIIENKKIIAEINTNNNIKNEEDEDLFPIKSNKQKEISEPGNFNNINAEKELQNTQDFHDYIASNPELKKQYDQLNNYCNFAVKSINYLVNKSTGMNNTPPEEAKKIEKANKQLNELLLEPVIKETEEKGYTIEDWNKKIEEEENRMSFETTNYDNYMKNAPIDQDRDTKLNKFKEHLFGFAEKFTTEELLEKITGIINNQNNNDNNNDINNSNNNSNNINNQENDNEENNNDENNNNININNNIEINNINLNNNNNINLQNAVQNFMNNLENNNNIEDEKSEITKEQSESVNENVTENNGRNTISSIGSLEIPKKYRHVYRGMVYYDEKPDNNDKNKKNNKDKNKKKIQEDDEIEEDDDEDEDEYNK